jgi:adhesin transport system outer membrane protein
MEFPSSLLHSSSAKRSGPVRPPVLLLAVFFAFAFPAARAEAPTAGWTFERVLSAALGRHPLVQARLSERAAASADLQAAGWARYPTPTAEATTRNAAGDPAGLLRLDQPLWSGGRITAGIDLAARRLDAAEAAVAERRLELAQRTVAAYFEALRQLARREVSDLGLREHERLLEMIRRRVAQEVSSRADERLAEARMQQAATERSFIVQSLRTSALQLAQLAGEPVPAESLGWAGLEAAAFADLPATLQQTLDAALTHAPALRRLAQEERASAAEIEQRRAAVLPQVALRLEHSAGGGSPQTRAMVVLQAQPGAGLSSQSAVAAATARREGARQALEAGRREVLEQAEAAWTDWVSARERLELVQRASDINAEVFDSYTRQFVIGRKSWVEVLNAVRETTQARYLVADARAQVGAAAWRLRALTGKLGTA